jgi:trehalose 6-phosphate phosphatase
LGELRSRKTLYAFDFDGTLCPIGPDRCRSVLPTGTASLLRELAKQAPVAVISGRSLSDLSARIDCGLVELVGNHGAERMKQATGASLARAARLCAQWERALIGGERRLSDIPGVELEQKKLSISLHFRKCDDRAEALLRLLSLVGELPDPPRLVHGDCVVNLVPEGSPHKGDALLALMSESGCDRALFVGDDVTDEDVFRLARLDPRILGVRVQPSGASAAEFYVRTQAEVDRLIVGLIPSRA